MDGTKQLDKQDFEYTDHENAVGAFKESANLLFKLWREDRDRKVP
jgi:hypothetical protein